MIVLYFWEFILYTGLIFLMGMLGGMAWLWSKL